MLPLVLTFLLIVWIKVFAILLGGASGLGFESNWPLILVMSGYYVWQRRQSLTNSWLLTAPYKPQEAFKIALLVSGLVLSSLAQVAVVYVAFAIVVTHVLARNHTSPAAFAVLGFPILFLLFMVPIPGGVVDQVTQPLKFAASYLAEELLRIFGYPVARTGVVLFIGQYQLLVADACAGLQTLFTLEALGVFYLKMMNPSQRGRILAMALLILPIGVIANSARVIVLVLTTYYFGDQVAQGFFHGFAGLLLFLIGLTLLVVADKAIPGGGAQHANTKG